VATDAGGGGTARGDIPSTRPLYSDASELCAEDPALATLSFRRMASAETRLMASMYRCPDSSTAAAARWWDPEPPPPEPEPQPAASVPEAGKRKTRSLAEPSGAAAASFSYSSIMLS
jgi:hypothetical protein